MLVASYVFLVLGGIFQTKFTFRYDFILEV